MPCFGLELLRLAEVVGIALIYDEQFVAQRISGGIYASVDAFLHGLTKILSRCNPE